MGENKFTSEINGLVDDEIIVYRDGQVFCHLSGADYDYFRTYLVPDIDESSWALPDEERVSFVQNVANAIDEFINNFKSKKEPETQDGTTYSEDFININNDYRPRS